MLNIVIPMAGAGSRFADAGYTDPKPLIPVHGVPMIRVVIENLRPSTAHRFIFVCQRQHLSDFGLRDRLRAWSGACSVVEIDGITEGAACTVLLTKSLIDDDTPLMIANCDQYIDTNMDRYLASMAERNLDGLIMTMWADDPKWSFVALDDKDHARRVVEKVVISTEATVGIYNYRRGADFVSAAERMIAKDFRVNGEFYVAPVYNELIAAGQKIGCFSIGEENNGMYGLGIPSDLEHFVSLPVSQQAVRGLAG